jgi:hypothetical protein
MEENEISYGTHTLPKKFWTIPEGKNCLKDPAYRARRAAKKERHDKRQIEIAERNRK